MDEYIKREAATESVQEKLRICEALPNGSTKAAAMLTLKSIQDSLESIPAADVRPVVKATWEQVEVLYEDELIDNPVQAVASMFCPNCQRYHNEVYFYGMPTERVNFCPNCGADMLEKEE